MTYLRGLPIGGGLLGFAVKLAKYSDWRLLAQVLLLGGGTFAVVNGLPVFLECVDHDLARVRPIAHSLDPRANLL